MTECEYRNICNLRVNDDLCNELGEFCARRKQYVFEKLEKIKEHQRVESEVIRMMEYNGHTGRDIK